jgi:hypothetical protein
MRRDTNLMAAADYHCADMDTSHLGRHTNAKKARGLMRAGGEASRHLYTDWPHNFVLVGSDNDRIFYKDLTIEQWSYGFLAIIEKEINRTIQANMIAHLKNTYMDAILYGFRRAKCVHGKILTEIEDGRLTWLEGDCIADTRKTHIQRPLTLEDYRKQQREEAEAATKRYNRNENFANKHYDFKSNESEERFSKRRSSPRGKKVNYKTCKFYNDSRCK